MFKCQHFLLLSVSLEFIMLIFLLILLTLITLRIRTIAYQSWLFHFGYFG